MGITLPILLLLVIDLVFVLIGFGLLKLLSRHKHAAHAVMKRNFVGYFSNPTGYLFILLFVGLCSASAFYPHDFFNDNLATLHQLNLWFPWIMLVYIPTITMGIWSEERRQGTDELLLTVPADDWDIVLGKYLSAAAIFTVSLLFSQVANFMVMASLSLGELDLGLFVTTYFGYWLIGLAMISIGMVGSFLTKNQTIGFILGAVFNLPLVISAHADAIFSSDFAQQISRLSYADQFFDFGRGVVSLRSIVFFGLVISIGLYLSVVLVGRRHWLGGKDGDSMLGHYVVRVIALMVFAFSLTFFFFNNDRMRFDGSSQQVSSLSSDTKTLLADLDESGDQTILIEAFISKKIPEDYAKTKIDLISKLNEFKARAGDRVDVRIYDNLEPSSNEAIRAEEQYGILPATVLIRERGAMRQEDIYLGAAFSRGLEKVVVPFFDQGIPVEYELIRSMAIVADPVRKKLGVVTTGAQLFGGFDMQSMRQNPKQLIIEELEKQYEIVQIDPTNPIQEKLDVMLAVQPSSLNPQQMDNFVAAVGRGIPTAIFEDPMPVMMGAVGTSQPNPPRGGMMGMGGQPGAPKGEMGKLWGLLGIGVVGKPGPAGQLQADVVWQKYNPYKKTRGMRQITDEWVFAASAAPGADEPLNAKSPVTSELEQILMLYPGGIRDTSVEGIEFTPLVKTGTEVGSIGYQQYSMIRDPRQLEFLRANNRTDQPFVLAAQIRSENLSENSDAVGQAEQGENPAETPGEAKKPATINVIYVSDIDLMHSEFLRVRAQPNMGDISWQFDNVTFVLNIIDALANDERFIDIRKRQTRHSTLKLVEEKTAERRREADAEIDKFNSEFEVAEQNARANQEKALQDLQSKVAELQKKAQMAGGDVDSREMQRALQAAVQRVAMTESVEQRRLETQVEQLTRDRDKKLRTIERSMDTEIQQVQNRYKAMALLLPMLPPLIIGLVVFIRRRRLEREGITSERRK
ncbi:MAG: ABC transporter permease subunit [Planctomycetaceae bacterium]|nr:ABC transporter permease subunit [Planctomycetaceae bacterium]